MMDGKTLCKHMFREYVLNSSWHMIFDFYFLLFRSFLQQATGEQRNLSITFQNSNLTIWQKVLVLCLIVQDKKQITFTLY